MHVFDVLQTEGDELPQFAEVSGNAGDNIEAVELLIRSWGIELLYEGIGGGADGVSKKGTIVIAPDLEPAKRLLTLVHEAAHEKLHADAARRKETTKTIRETEAEAVAHVVCRALGLDIFREQVELRLARVAELNRQLTLLRNQRDQLLNLRLLEEIEQSTFAEKNTELRDRIAAVTLQVEACDRSSSERADIAVKAFELSQTLKQKWVNADHRAKRQILEILCLNFFLDGATLVPEWRKPFDMLAEGLVSENSRGDKTAIELFRAGVGSMSHDMAVVAQGLMAHNLLA